MGSRGQHSSFFDPLAGWQQLDLLATTNGEARDKLMADQGQLNQRYGSGAVIFAAACVKNGQQPAWDSRVAFKSPAYTTSWNQLWTIITFFLIRYSLPE